MLSSVWLKAREADAEGGGKERGSAFMSSTVEQAATHRLMSISLHWSSSCLLSICFHSFVPNFLLLSHKNLFPHFVLFRSLALSGPQLFSIKRVQGVEGRVTWALVSGAGSTQRSAATRNHCCNAKNWAVAACVCICVCTRGYVA